MGTAHLDTVTAATPSRSSAPFGARAGEPLLSARGVAKAFGATRALRSCSFELRAGEVHVIVGENGSGKSTLVKILSGVHRPDAGDLLLAAASRAPRGPRAAQDAGVVTVFQEVLVVEAQSVLDNVWLGSDGLFRRSVSPAEKRRRANEVLTSLLGSAPELDRPIETLSLSERQACCVARALVRDPRVLILDESTSALDVATRDRLFEIVRGLCADGVGVIFISHRMDEIAELADRVTVLRSGESVATLSRAEATTDVLVRHMTGDERLTAGVQEVAPRERRIGDVVLRAEGVRLRPGAQPIDMELREGELVGLAGLEGHGQEAFLRALWGAGASGRVARVGADGETVITSPSQAVRAGVAFVPRDRRRESIFPTLPVVENFALPTLPADRRGGLLRWRSTVRRLTRYIKELGIRPAAGGHPITALSGGNQQKVIVARWLAASPRVLLLNDPTRGVDIGAKRDLYRLLEELAAEGLLVVMLSSELDEHVELADRVLVFREGALAAELPRERLSRGALVASYFGRGEARDD